MHEYVVYIIYGVILIQIFVLIKSWRRMKDFGTIFLWQKSWKIEKNEETGFVTGIAGSGNLIFDEIKQSINKYLRNNTGSVIDFALLKDAVDRHCDSVESEIAAQTPIPLYFGLAGTMAGVIFGLWDLLDSGAILTLMGSGAGQIDQSAVQAAQGIDALLSGVALAMVASICGILMTTIISLRFKSCKNNQESGKNAFLAWMQSVLLPELPSDTSEALNKLVRNLNKFNNTFASNTAKLGNALQQVNESYAIQADIIKAVHDMDVTKMAKANVNVLRELQECTDKLETFNDYLYEVEGYTQAIHRFEEQFGEQADRLAVMEEIRDFFRSYKGSMAKVTADTDNTLRQALKQIESSTTDSVQELHKTFVKQAEQFRAIIKAEGETFEKLSAEMHAQFDAQMKRLPQVAKKMDELSQIPTQLDKMIDKIEKSNKAMSESMAKSLELISKRLEHTGCVSGNQGAVISSKGTPMWMKLTSWLALLLIAGTSVYSVLKEYDVVTPPSLSESMEVVADSCVTLAADTSYVQTASDTIR